MKNTRSIKENHVFRALYARGKSAACRTMVLYARKHRDGAVNQLGITVSVKLGCAAERNRIRRRLKEAYRLNETRLNYACSLLLRTDQSVTDAALNSGFESLRTFHRVFREHFHQTPGSFRKTLPVGEEL